MKIYKIQVTVGFWGEPHWMTIRAESEVEAQKLVYLINPQYCICATKQWDGVEGSYYN
jgi:hypothetical protein